MKVIIASARLTREYCASLREPRGVYTRSAGVGFYLCANSVRVEYDLSARGARHLSETWARVELSQAFQVHRKFTDRTATSPEVYRKPPEYQH